MTDKIKPVSYATAKRRLDGKERVKLDRNTYLERRDDKTIAVLYHATDVVTFTPHWIELDTGGWHTMSSADRIRDYIPGGLMNFNVTEWLVILVTGGTLLCVILGIVLG